VRRSCHTRLRDDMIDDFVVASEIRAQGLRTIYEPEAIAFERTNKGYADEFNMRVRIIKQTLNALARYRTLLNWRENGSFMFQMISHKVLRYLVPFFLLAAFIANAVLVNWQSLSGLFSVAGVENWLVTSSWLTKIFTLAFLGQGAFYLTAVGGYFLTKLGLKPLGVLALPLYFVVVNVAAFVAVVKLIGGEHYVVWEPIREPEPSRIEPIRPLARG
jgi:cellulose synthase/poly-beta-1,6-N-acetylglucosamine synthase-like glycosyltransferase